MFYDNSNSSDSYDFFNSSNLSTNEFTSKFIMHIAKHEYIIQRKITATVLTEERVIRMMSKSVDDHL